MLHAFWHHRRLALAMLVLLATIAGSRNSARSLLLATGAATPAPSGVVRERLLADEPRMLDEIGRIPIGRLSFMPGLGLPAAGVPGPLLVLVERGSFEVRLNDATTSASAGDRIAVAAGETIGGRNTEPTTGSWLILTLDREPRQILTPWEAPAPGLTYQLLYPYQSLTNRLRPALFSLDRVMLASGAVLDTVDLGGGTPARYISVLVESGEVTLTGSPTGAAGAGTPAAGATPVVESVLMASDIAEVAGGETAEVRNVGTEPAVLLLARVAAGTET